VTKICFTVIIGCGQFGKAILNETLYLQIKPVSVDWYHGIWSG